MTCLTLRRVRHHAALLAALSMLLMAAACGDAQPSAEPADEQTAEGTPSPTADDDAQASAPPETIEDVIAAVEGLELDERRVQLMRMVEAEDGPVLVYTSM